MRVFDKGNWGETTCPVCKNQNEGKVVLVPVVGSGDNPESKYQNFEAKQIHLDCLDLWLDEKVGFIYQRLVAEGLLPEEE